MEISKTIAHAVASSRYENIPEKTIENVKLGITDAIGVGFAGTASSGYESVLDLMKGFGGRPDAAVLMGGVRLPAPAAAFLNAYAIHAYDFDDTFDEGTVHCYCIAFSAALAAAESIGGVSGKDFLTAVTVGADLTARLAGCITSPVSWVRTPTCGSFGAAAAAARILGLDEKGVLNALGIVYNQTAGNFQCAQDGGLVKNMLPGFAAEAGVRSALMARAGVSGAVSVFEGPYGFFNLYEQGRFRPDYLLDGLGRDFFTDRLSIKPYPACRMAHAAIDAALEIQKQEDFRPEDVEEIRIGTSRMCRSNVGRPFEIRSNPQVEAQFSIPYTVSIALNCGACELPHFREDFILRPEWQAYARKVSVFEDPALPEKEIRSASLLARLKDGRELSAQIKTFLGHPDNPVSTAFCLQKFDSCADCGRRHFTPQQKKAITDRALHLEELEDVRALADLLL